MTVTLPSYQMSEQHAMAVLFSLRETTAIEVSSHENKEATINLNELDVFGGSEIFYNNSDKDAEENESDSFDLIEGILTNAGCNISRIQHFRIVY